jgi:hypothetical protein
MISGYRSFSDTYFGWHCGSEVFAVLQDYRTTKIIKLQEFDIPHQEKRLPPRDGAFLIPFHEGVGRAGGPVLPDAEALVRCPSPSRLDSTFLTVRLVRRSLIQSKDKALSQSHTLLVRYLRPPDLGRFLTLLLKSSFFGLRSPLNASKLDGPIVGTRVQTVKYSRVRFRKDRDGTVIAFENCGCESNANTFRPCCMHQQDTQQASRLKAEALFHSIQTRRKEDH